LLTIMLKKTFHEHISTKSEYYTLPPRHLWLHDGSTVLTTKMHEYLVKFKILQKIKIKKSKYKTFRDQEATRATN
jgi:hypothetical protein